MRLVGQEYELEKKLEGAQAGNLNASKQRPQNGAVDPERTRERLAKEHGISKALVSILEVIFMRWTCVLTGIILMSMLAVMAAAQPETVAKLPEIGDK